MALKDEDYDKFWETLPTMAIMANNPDLRRQFAAEYKQETIGLLGMLQRLGLAGGVTQTHPDPPTGCDECGQALDRASFFVDGEAQSGMWANMCGRCFYAVGIGIGWGIGQLYWNVGDGKWRLIAGNDPDAEDE